MFKYIRKLLALFILALPLFAVAATDLADKPLLTGNSVPGNVAITISAEFPTALTYAYAGTIAYSTSTEFIGYFDPKKCYSYDTANHYFIPDTLASAHTCSSRWSGNFLNWATMQSLDPFRQTLTGGNRIQDTASLTVLEKAWSSGQGSYKNRVASISGKTLIGQSTPFSNWSNFYIRIDMLGNQIRYTGSTSPDVTSANTLALVASTTVVADTTADSSKAASNKIYQKFGRVKVCDALVGLESNCFQYPNGNYKPIGLIQNNAMKLRFSAFGYLADSAYMNDNGYTGTYTTAGETRNQNLQGGVLRAKMASLGPLKPDPGKPSVDNSGPTGTSEWDANTGVFEINPDPTDASTTEKNNGFVPGAVPNSGVINYLNKFGSTAGRYKVYDRTAELYYAAIRYFKNLPNVPAYTNMVGYTTAEKQVLIDGFPVITAPVDPINYSCQANFIIGIGDNNTYTAGNLPGSKSTSGTVPPEVKNDKSVDVSIATNRVGALQGLGNIGDGSSFLMGGLAFDSHTVDIRPDIPNIPPDKQTVTTYWLDVLESGYVANNQYVLATKFGGFAVPANYDSCSTSATSATCATPPNIPTNIPTTTVGDTTWDKNGDGLPDNYFMANNPLDMQIGLTNAFADIISTLTGSSNTFAVTSPSVLADAMSFATSYKAATWTGNVVGNTVTFTGDIPVETVAWNASAKLDAQGAGTGWDSARKIATSTCTAGIDGTQTCAGTPFRPANLTSLLPNFAALPADQANAVNFLRGDASNTGSLGKASFRSRASLLGDIVNSKVVAVGPPRAPYTEDFNPGYLAFKNVNASRATVAYVGANDGMLHAFNGVPAGGNELFAYVPNALIKGPTNTPLVNGLAALAQPVYNHKYFVDATPVIADVDFGVSDWHSVLIGGLGKGGKAYYALDVTNPAGISSEGILSANVLWEFTHKNMGYSYGKPLVVKTLKYGWTVILTSGYNNADGNGYFFLVNPKTGALLEAPIPTGNTTTNDAGLAHVNAFVTDARDFLVDAAYAGDALGNVWRLDLSGTGAIPAPKKIAAFGSTHPITVHPIIEIDKSTLKRYVFVGTGRILADSDVKSTDEQYFYAILDGTQTAPFLDGTEGKGPSTLPSGGSYPVTPLQMVDDTNTITTTGVIADKTKPMGYFVDLGTNGASPYRVNVDMISSAGVVAFAANSLGGDACSPSGNNKLYAITYGSGKSVIVDSFGNFSSSFAGTGLATSVSFFRRDGSTTTRINISNDTGTSTNVQVNPSSATGFTPLNWRELPTSD